MAGNTYMQEDELAAAARIHQQQQQQSAKARPPKPASPVEAEPANLPAVSEAAPVRTTPPALGLDYLPDAGELDRLMRLADVVSRAGMVPASYRSTVARDGEIVQDKRPNVMVAALMGRTFGWDLLTAMRNIHVIEGAATLKPEALLGLIRARGHRVRIIRDTDRVTVHGLRADTGDQAQATFTFEDAYRAGLARRGDNGLPFARSQQGKPLPWEQYPVDMCQWRAVAIVARSLFSDIALGLSYTPEELGAVVDAEGAVVVESAPMPAPEPPAPQESTVQRVASRTTSWPTPESGQPSLEDRLAKAKADQEARNAARHSSSPVNNAKARALDAVKHAYPGWTLEEALAEIRSELQMIDPQLTTANATADRFHTIGAKYELVELERIQGGHNA